MTTHARKKASYHHGDLRSAILRSAGNLMEKQGVGGLSLRAAARRAGVSHNAPYRHFPDRDALLAALGAEGFGQLQRALEGKSGRELGAAYVRFALERPERFRLMFGARLAKGGSPELRAQAQATFGALQGAFAALGADAEYAAVAAWSLVHGLAHLILDGHLGRARDAAGGDAAFVQRVLGTIRFAAGAQRTA
jgi:AcrR family transcriptional regulator